MPLPTVVVRWSLSLTILFVPQLGVDCDGATEDDCTRHVGKAFFELCMHDRRHRAKAVYTWPDTASVGFWDKCGFAVDNSKNPYPSVKTTTEDGDTVEIPSYRLFIPDRAITHVPTVRVRHDIKQRVRSVPFQSLYSFASRCQRRGWLQLLTTDELAPVPTVAGTATPVPTVAGTATPVPTVAIQAPDSADRGAAALVDLGANARVTELSTEFARTARV